MTPLELTTLVTAILGIPLVAGAIGGIIRWVMLKEEPRQGLGSIVIGAFAGHYLNPFSGQWFAGMADAAQVAPESIRGSSAFVIGIGGIWVIQYAIDVVRKRTELKKES